MKLLLLIILAAAPLCLPAKRRFDNEKVFRVTPQNEEEVNLLKYLDKVMKLDFWKPESSHHVIPKTVVDFHANKEDSEIIIGYFDQKRINYRILFQNVQEVVESQFKKNGQPQKNYNNMKFEKYRTWPEIATWCYYLSITRPDLVSCIPIGNTYEGRPILIFKVGSPKPKNKDIFLECGAHAREWISPAFCQWFVNEAIQSYGKDKTMTKLMDSANFHVLPVFNVDGYVWTWTYDRMWRKNRSPIPNAKCVGTDLNRNFNISWNQIDTNETPCSEIYSGSAAESENEVKAVTSYIRDKLTSFKAYISFHSCGQMLMYPYGYTEKEAPNNDKLNQIAVSALKSLSSLYGTNYTYGPIATTIYKVSGCSIDWIYDEGVKYSFVFELRDECEYNFLLPEYEIKPTCKETMLAVKTIASHALGLV
ncbi:mast cell carboxypeptidase A-like [Bombina bombina]|uniref:mast cell carboxypeptidase A-like n=1 Tax=Bombina bombina TaxID=8345 RepID=UPI00235B13D8|nr:mast cell carboxypeptidase A-like [Bombina bombina]